jgi:hypothetical protein
MKNSIFQAPEPFTKEFDKMLEEAPNMYAVLVHMLNMLQDGDSDDYFDANKLEATITDILVRIETPA